MLHLEATDPSSRRKKRSKFIRKRQYHQPPKKANASTKTEVRVNGGVILRLSYVLQLNFWDSKDIGTFIT
jgi:hypothetical protein